MKYLLVLTTTEAKKFIAKSIVQRHKGFRKALEQGMIVIHPSTSTVFVYEEIVGKKPEGLWFCGAVTPKGTCISKEFEEMVAQRKKNSNQKDFSYSWVFKKNQLFKGLILSECLREMGPGDYYLKGVNAIDNRGNAGVLTANSDGGTITRVMAQARQRNFEIMLFSTINKLINISIEKAVKVTKSSKLIKAMKLPVRLFKVKGTLITETEAFNLQGVKATPIASGGMCEAEGAGIFVIEGEKKDVKSCLEVIEECKGAYLNVSFPDCKYCRYNKCPYSVVNYPA